MAYKVIWSKQALEDLRDIVSFIAADNRSAAQSFGLRLMAKVDVLEKFPKFGRVVPELGLENLREIILRPYRIVYQVIEEQRLIAIARIWHGARGEPQIPTNLDF